MSKGYKGVATTDVKVLIPFAMYGQMWKAGEIISVADSDLDKLVGDNGGTKHAEVIVRKASNKKVSTASTK